MWQDQHLFHLVLLPPKFLHLLYTVASPHIQLWLNFWLEIAYLCLIRGNDTVQKQFTFIFVKALSHRLCYTAWFVIGYSLCGAIGGNGNSCCAVQLCARTNTIWLLLVIKGKWVFVRIWLEHIHWEILKMLQKVYGDDTKKGTVFYPWLNVFRVCWEMAKNRQWGG